MTDIETPIDAPAPDATVEAAPEATVDDLVVPDDIDLALDEPAGEPAAPEAGADPFADFGGRDVVEQAIRVHQLTQSDEGVVQLFIEAGRSLGLSFDQMEALFRGEALPAAEEEDLDRPITARELREMEEQRAAQAAAARTQEAAATAQRAIQSTVTELGLTMEDPATKLILQYGDKHFDRNDLSPEAVRNAVLRGHAEYQADLDKQARAYLAKKREKAGAVPSAPAGASAPSGESMPEPKDSAEAAARVRKMLGI